MSDLHQLLALAKEAALRASERLRKGLQTDRAINFQDARDVKLQADLESEAIVREFLSQQSGLPLIGEEQGGDPALFDERNELYWIVDPLDGTFNYLRGLPATCVSIGLWKGQQPILGVIHDFQRAEVFTGIAGGEQPCALLNGDPLQPNWASDYTKASLITGFPVGRDYTAESLTGFIELVQRFKKIRMLGSAALALAYVAAGRADAYTEDGIRLWDIAAGLAILKATGGTYRMIPQPGKPLASHVFAVGPEALLPCT